ncbi:hypothetical protein ACFC0C_28930 [Streptomyces sp. NPDC056178]
MRPSNEAGVRAALAGKRRFGHGVHQDLPPAVLARLHAITAQQ